MALFLQRRPGPSNRSNVAPGSRRSILLFWTAGFREFLLWYVNLETRWPAPPSASTTWIVYSTLR